MNSQPNSRRTTLRQRSLIMPVVKADLEACQGYANCVVGATDYFDLDDDGIVVLLKTEVPETDRARVVEAARSCPVSALIVED
ncbi:MAG: ferredoxin [Arthrobacter sp.]|nr:ferredoxin [Arthrobacter sp.]